VKYDKRENNRITLNNAPFHTVVTGAVSARRGIWWCGYIGSLRLLLPSALSNSDKRRIKEHTSTRHPEMDDLKKERRRVAFTAIAGFPPCVKLMSWVYTKCPFIETRQGHDGKCVTSREQRWGRSSDGALARLSQRWIFKYVLINEQLMSCEHRGHTPPPFSSKYPNVFSHRFHNVLET